MTHLTVDAIRDVCETIRMARPKKNPRDRVTKVVIYPNAALADWLKQQSARYSQSLTVYILAPHMPAFRAMNEGAQQSTVANPPPVEPLPGTPVVVRAVEPPKRSSPADAANPCADCANMRCEPGTEPCFSCGAPANPDRWQA